MKSTSFNKRIAPVALLFLTFGTPAVALTNIDAANAGINWLLLQRNPEDGSWGATDDVKYVQTSEVVLALSAMNRRTPEYYAGITWLENHSPINVDFKARRILALQSNGNNVSADLQYLQSAQNLIAPGNSGWGLSNIYQGSGLDTALSLQAYNQAGGAINANAAISYLIGSQLPAGDAGWAIGQETTSDPVTTAQVLLALLPLQLTNSSLPAVSINGLAALNAKVSTYSPISYQAFCLLANYRSNNASVNNISLLLNLSMAQGIDGSWGGNVYDTALAIRALAVVAAADVAALRTPVVVPDLALKAAINQALGRNALDNLTQAELVKLTTLNISGLGVADLTGLQYASNLTSLIAVNNNIFSTAPLGGLTKLTSVQLSGNPVGPILALSVPGLTFPQQMVGIASAPQTVTLMNTGGSVLNIANIVAGGDYSLTSTCAATLTPSATCAINVTFKPTFMSTRNGYVAVTSDDTRSAQTLALTGSGVITRSFDFDGNGKKDILQYDSITGKTSAWLINGLNIASNAALYTDPAWQPIATPDINGDGKSDVVLYNSATGATAVWLLNGSTVLSSVTLMTDLNWKVTTTADFNGDGKADLVWYNASTGATAVWLMNGTTILSNVTELVDPNLKVVSTGDFNGDGKSDLVWFSPLTGSVLILQMNGTTSLGGAFLYNPDLNQKPIATADFNGDGKADLVWYNSVTGATSIWLMNGTTILSNVNILTDVNSKVIATSDFNGDGMADLVFYNAATGVTSVYLMNGTTVLSSAAVITDINSKLIATPDLDGDGKSDLVWYVPNTGQTNGWLMNGTTVLNSAVLFTDLAPKIATITPNSGLIAGGTAVTITGYNFTTPASVMIGNNVATSCAVLSANSITCITPAGTAGIQNIVVTEPVAGQGNISTTMTAGYTYTTPPVVLSGVVPNSGPVAGGTPITVSGYNFTAAATVTIRGSLATCTVVNSTTITCMTPPGTAGYQDVVVTQGVSSSTLVGAYTYTAVVNTPPAVAAPTPIATGVTTTGLTLSWSAVVGATGYVVYQNGVMLPVVSGVATSQTIAGLTANTSYSFSVAYKNTAGVLSSPSAVITVATSNVPAPTPTATGVTATGLTLNWTAVAGATGYVVYQNGVMLPVVSGVATSQIIAGLTANTSYNFSVAYKNAAGVLSLPSALFTVVTQSNALISSAGPSPVPTAVLGAAGTGQLTLNWTAVAGATGYVVYKNGVVQVLTPVVVGTSVSVGVPGLVSMTSYNFRTAFKNAAGVLSAPSTVLTVAAP